MGISRRSVKQRKQRITNHRRRIRGLESLETRLLLNADWQNPFTTRDTNFDRVVTPIDALVPINELNNPQFIDGTGALPDRATHASAAYYDVNGDGFLTPADVRSIINALNQDETPPTVSVELAHDSAPRGTSDTDQVTFSSRIVGQAIDDLTGIGRVEYSINGGPPQSLIPEPDGSFEITPVLAEGENDVVFRAFDGGNNDSGDSPALHFTFDTTPPEISFTDGGPFLTRDNLQVSGQLTDNLAGVESLLAQVDLQDVTDVSFNENGLFSFTASLPTDATADGQHVVRFRATDRAGNVSTLSTIDWQLDTRPPTVTTTASGVLRNNISTLELEFDEAMAAAAYDVDSYTLMATSGPNSGQAIPIASIDQDGNLATLNLNAPLANAEYRLELSSAVTDGAGNRATTGQLAFTVEQPTAVSAISPADGEELVSLTRETIVRFDGQVDPATVTPDTFYLIANGERLPGTIRVSSTERFATFFYDAPLPPATEVRVMVDGNAIIGRDGLPIDADGDQQPGGVGNADFRTVPLTFIPGTRLYGYIYDSYNRNPDGSDIPVEGATVFLDAAPEVFAVTDENGFFELGLQDLNNDGVADGLPAPEFFVHLDGSTAVNAPSGTAYATLGKPFHTVPGEREQLNMQGEPFDIYLPPMAMDDIVELDPDADTQVGFGTAAEAQIRQMFAADPDTAQMVIDTMQVTYPAGSAQDENGNPATRATVIPVDPERLPAPLPPGADPQLVVSIQAGTDAGFNLAGGSTNFEVPASISFPNLQGLPPGEQTSIVSFDHDAGAWKAVGTATVTENGELITSDPGQGILAPGWHFLDELAEVLGVADAPRKAEAFLNINKAKTNIALALPALLQSNPYGRVGAAAVGATGLANRLGVGAVGGYSLNERIGLGISLVAIAAGVTVGGPVAAGVAAFSIGFNLGNVINNLGTLADELGGTDPPCSPNGGTTPGSNVVAARLCVIAANDSVATVRNVGPQLDNALTIINQTLFGRGLQERFGDDLANLLVTMDASANVTVMDIATGDPAIDPLTGELYDIDIADLLPDTLTQGETSALTGLADSGELPRIADILHQAVDDDAPTSLQRAISLLDRAADGLKRPSRVGVIAVGGLRKNLSSSGSFRFLLRANTNYTARLVDAATSFVKTITFRTGGPGSTITLPKTCIDVFELGDNGENDLDGDGLGPIGESVVGTLATAADTDVDGIDDLTELRLGLDPLGGRGFPTGVIANLQLLGESKSIVIAGELADATQQTAYIATGSHGLAVVDASRFDQPVVLGQLGLNGDARDVAVDPLTSVAVVAAGEGGLHFIDVSDAMMPSRFRTIGSVSSQVELVDGVAYAVSGSRITAYDGLSGEVVTSLIVPNSGEINHLAHEGNFLYALDDNLRLFVIEASRFNLETRGSVVLPQGGKISINNGIAFVGAQESFGLGGFVTVDVADPDNPAVISGSDLVDPFVAPGLEIEPNGSGLGLAIGIVGQRLDEPVVGIADVSDLQATDNYLTQFPLPAIPQGVAIASGIGYIADGNGGLVVVNYVPFDNLGQPPAVTATGPQGTQIQEGLSVPIRVDVTDDVQVRNVELLMDGRVVANDVSAPFELRAVTPALASGATTVSFQVRATDTGGNRGLSDTLTYTLTPDITPPVVVGSSPADGGAGFRVNAITVRFDEPIDTTQLAVSGFTLTNLGADFRIGGGDDTTVALNRLEALSPRRIVVYTEQPLLEGRFQLTGDSTVISDVAGNHVEEPFAITFASFDVDEQNAVAWISDSDGDWNDGGNWSSGFVPGPNDAVIIDRKTANVTVSLPSGDIRVRSVVARDALVLNGGSLTITEPSETTARFEIGNGSILTADGAEALFVSGSSTKIDGGSLIARAGGRIHLPLATSYTQDAGQSTATVFRASGTGSVVDLQNLVGIDLGTNHSVRLDVEALAGGEVDLGSVTQVTSEAANEARKIRLVADGVGSLLDIANLTNLAIDSAWSVDWNSDLIARNGGTLHAPALTTLRHVTATLDGTGTLQTASWQHWTDGAAMLTGPTYEFPSLMSAAGTDFSASGGGVDMPVLTTLERGRLTLAGGATANVPLLSNIDGASLLVSGGVSLSVPMATSYTQNSGGSTLDTLRASGVGSRLDLGNVTTIDLGPNHVAELAVEALAGGQVELSSLTQVTSADQILAREIRLVADGVGSMVDLTMLASLAIDSEWAIEWYSDLIARNGGTLHAPALTTLRHVTATLDGTGTLQTASWQHWTDGAAMLIGPTYEFPSLMSAAGTDFSASGGGVDMPVLTTLERGRLTLAGGATANVPLLSNIDGASLLVSGGVTLSVPMATSYTQNSGGSTLDTLRASGVGSRLDLGNVTTIDLGPNHVVELAVEAFAGGQVDLGSLTQVTSADQILAREIRLVSDGVGSMVDLTMLASLAIDSEWAIEWYSDLIARNGGTLHAPALTTLRHVTATLDGTGTLQTASWQHWTDGAAVLTGPTYEFPSLVAAAGTDFNASGGGVDMPVLTTLERGRLTLAGGATANVPQLSNIDGSSLLVSGGVTLSVPMATSYIQSSGGSTVDTLRASGVGSRIDLGNVTTIDLGPNHVVELAVEAHAGGKVDLGSLTQVTSANQSSAREIGLVADGVGSMIDLTMLASLAIDSFWDTGWQSDLIARSGGAIQVSSNTSLRNTVIEVSATGTIDGNLVIESSATLQGSEGTVAGNVENRGTVRPGDSPGILQIDGNFSQSAGGTLSIEIGGPGAGVGYDQLDITGTATLDGTLELLLVDQFDPPVGFSVDAIKYGSRAGTFSVITGQDLGDGKSWTPGYDPTVFTLTSTSALRGTLAADEGASGAAIRVDKIRPLVEIGISRWVAAGLSPQEAARLAGVQLRVVDLEGDQLALAGGNTIWIDENAAGMGWFVDPAPTIHRNLPRVAPTATAVPADNYDLLSVVMHELGHLLDLEHSVHENDLLQPTLEPGERLHISPHDVDALFSEQGENPLFR